MVETKAGYDLSRVKEVLLKACGAVHSYCCNHEASGHYCTFWPTAVKAAAS